MKYKSRAIALTYIKQGDSSIIAKLFTEKKGLQTFIIKGVRSKKSKNNITFFEPLKQLSINGLYKPKNSLQYLDDIRLENSFGALRKNMFNVFISVFIAEVSSKVLQENDKNPALFIFLWETAQALSLENKSNSNYVLTFMLNLSRYLGFYPSISEIKKSFFDLERGIFSDQLKSLDICMNKKNTLYLKALIKNEPINIPQKDKSILLQKLIRYYTLHHYNIENIKSHLVIESLRV
ncbi:MAG: DNA repair protein RecO [Flavobacteriales bacterium]|nr:DNA repair protein RecO [Flavobacteriales bacterium]|tara:strand:+ start:77397 stop:78104 length:708 start_codon:yes stop_codon:yes gene_type:complete